MKKLMVLGVSCFVIVLVAYLLPTVIRGTPKETFTETRTGEYKTVVRTQKFHNSGTVNVDICVTKASDGKIQNEKQQCFLHGYDFDSDLSVHWLSPSKIEISYKCGRVTSFRNSALVYPNGPVPQEFHAILREDCAYFS
jgi:putative transposon-encoded protein